MKSFERLPRWSAIALVIGAAIVPPSVALAHGSPFSVGYDGTSGRITVTFGGGNIYRNFSIDEMLVSDGTFVTNAGEPGFQKAGSLPAGAPLRIRFLRELLYWNPQAGTQNPLPTPGATMIVDGLDAATLSSGAMASVSAIGPGNPTGILDDATYDNPLGVASFTGHHHVYWTLENPDTSGLYGLWASLESTNPAVFDALPSDPFLVVLNYGVTDAAAYDIGVDRLAATAVPEPSTLALVAVAIAAGAWRSWKHRGRTTSRTSPTASSPRITHHDMSSSHQR